MTQEHMNTHPLPHRPIASRAPHAFADFVRNRLSVVEFETVLRDLFGSPHMRTKILTTPERITAHQTVVLSALLRTSAWDLHHIYGVGADTVSYEEAVMWWLLKEYASNNNQQYEQALETLRVAALFASGDSSTLQHDGETNANTETTTNQLAQAAG